MWQRAWVSFVLLSSNKDFVYDKNPVVYSLATYQYKPQRKEKC